MLKEYLYEHLLNEKEIILKLLAIDNKICHSNLTYEDLLMMFKKDLSLEEIKTYNHFITDGNIYIVYLILLNYAPYIINLYIDKRYLAINSWLVWKCKNYYQDLGINYEINLDTSINMLSYQQFSNIVIVGDNGFITGIKKDFPKGIFKIMEIN